MVAGLRIRCSSSQHLVKLGNFARYFAIQCKFPTGGNRSNDAQAVVPPNVEAHRSLLLPHVILQTVQIAAREADLQINEQGSRMLFCG